MKSLIVVLALGFLAGCQANSDPSDQCTCPETKMEDLDFFGVYFSACVQAVTDMKELYALCGHPESMADVRTCVWFMWDGGQDNGQPSSGCTRLVSMIAAIMAQPDPCSRIYVPAPGSCDFAFRQD